MFPVFLPHTPWLTCGTPAVNPARGRVAQIRHERATAGNVALYVFSLAIRPTTRAFPHKHVAGFVSSRCTYLAAFFGAEFSQHRRGSAQILVAKRRSMWGRYTVVSSSTMPWVCLLFVIICVR
ncbi:hypothetical protein FA13DRAFT_1483709 [Coprinellus micaceus]|uniref:Uncharacterized protein n=1 Tax=Coprinellus micaceus TaxID=71717 RepID=A0A4Y7TKI5_COPMI|nr:hypothetical protein FA13DRAFT_1483709 [Coprinellus micaceus]